MSRRTRAHSGTGSGEDGFATLALPMLVWVATLVAVVTIDIGAYLVAASRAQTLADAAALAAVSADVVGARAMSPRAEAVRVARAGDGELERCDCVPGAEVASVTVSVAVPGLVIPDLGAGRVAADAQAVLAPPDDLPPGPTRERLRWPRFAGVRSNGSGDRRGRATMIGREVDIVTKRLRNVRLVLSVPGTTHAAEPPASATGRAPEEPPPRSTRDRAVPYIDLKHRFIQRAGLLIWFPTASARSTVGVIDLS